MSTTIDERVVEMRFDNKQFESNVQTSLSTLDKLKKSLNLSGAAKGLENIDKAAKKVDVSGIGTAVDTVRMRFSALEVMGMTALANITNSAVNAGKQIASALTIEPIKSGFEEYETQINAVQTILANTESKGSTLKDVNNALDELNKYADMTIYNFTEMTRNIGTFTAAGVDLDTSVSAIKGIANLAAVSGSTSQQASTAMYQLSQALAAGTVKLQDWNSVVNAGMGGQVFQDALKETARVHGIAIDQMIKDEGSFRETLSKGWLTSEILTDTLSKFTGDLNEEQLRTMGYTEEQITSIIKMGQTANDAATKVKTFTQLFDTLKEAAQSGWTQSWELIVGDFEQAKESLTGLSDKFSEIINSSANARNELLVGALAPKSASLADWDKLYASGLAFNNGFIESLKEAAREHGVAIDQMIEDEGSFRQTIKNGWLSNEILTEAFNNMSKGAQKSEEYVVQAGDTLSALAEKYGITVEELAKANGIEDVGSIAVGQVLKISEALTGSIELTKEQKEAYDELSGSLDKVSGRDLLWQSLMNSIDAVIKVVSTLKQAWREVFPPATSDQLYGMIEALHSFSEKLILSDEVSEKLKRTMQGLFSIAKIAADVLSAFLTVVGNVATGLSSRFGGSILDTAAAIGDLLVSFKDWIESSGIVVEAMDNISRGLLTGIDRISAWVGEFFKIQSVQNGISELGSAIGNTIDKISTYLKNGKDAISNSGIINALEMIWNVVKSIAGGIANTVGNLVGYISESFSKSGFENFFDIASALAAGGIAVGITKFIRKLKEPFDGLGDILENVTGALGSVRESLEAYQTKLKAGSLLSIATAVGILAASLVAISLIESDKLSSSIGAITMLFGELVAAFGVLEKINAGKGSVKNIAVLIGMASAVAILAGSMKTLASLEWTGIAKGLVGIAGLCGILTVVSEQLSNEGKRVMKGAAQLVIFAAAIKILASACKALSVFNWEELGKGLVGVGALFGEVALFLNTAKFQKRAVSSATGILILSAALKVLASVCKDFGAMSWENIGKGLAGIAGLFTELAVFTNLTGNAKHVLRTGVSMIAIAASMKIMASAVSDFGSLNWEQIGRGLSAMGGALIEVAAAANLMPKNMIGIGAGLIAVGVSLKIISDVLGKMGEMSWDAIAKGLTTLGGSMAELAIGLNLMKGTISGSAALLVASAALAVLTPVLKALGSMSWESIAKGLVSLGGAFLIMGVAGAVLGPLVPAILGLSGAITLIGLGVAAAGIGMLAFGAGLTAVSVGFRALVESVADSGVSVASGIAEIAKGLALGVVEFARVIKDGAPDLGEALIVLVTEACEVISQCAPQITQAFFDLLVGALNGLSDYIPEIGNSLFDILIGLFNTIAERIPELIQAGAGVISSIFEGVLGLFGEVDGNGLISTIVSIGEGLVGDIGEAIEGIISDIGEKIGSFVDGVGSTIGSFFGNIAGGFEAGVSEHLPEIGTNLSLFMTSASGFFDGVKGIDASSLAGVSTLAQAILEITAADLLDSITSFISGGSSLESFGESLTQFGMALVSYSNTVKDLDSGAVAKSADAGLLVASLADAVPKSGGVIQFFTGTSDLANFGESLACFGAGLSAYSNSVKDLDSDAVEKSVSAGLLVASLADAVPKSGGIVEFFTGKSDLSDFGSNLEAFGESLSAYSKSIADVDADGIAKTTTAANALVELNKAIPKDDGSGWFSDSFIGTFGSNLESFGAKFAAFYSEVGSIDAGKLSSIVDSMNTLVEFTKSTAGLDTSGLSSFGDALSNLGNTGVQGFMEAVSNSTADISGSAEGMMNALVAGVSSKGSSLSSAFKTTITASLSGIKSNFAAFLAAGQSLVANLQNGINSRTAALTSSFTSAISQMVSLIRGQYGSMYSSGVYLGQGLVSGINAMQNSAYSAGYALGAAAVRGEKDGQHSNSPSKDTIKAGGWLGEGLVIGMKKMASRVYTSGQNLGASATESITSAFSRINDIINGDIDVQPTIRPVLDLSDIQSGAGRLTTLLTGQQSVGVLANVSAISAGMNSRSARGNEDVVSAIKGLRKDMNSRSAGNTYYVNGITYDDGSNVSGAVQSLIRAVKVERRV